MDRKASFLDRSSEKIFSETMDRPKERRRAREEGFDELPSTAIFFSLSLSLLLMPPASSEVSQNLLRLNILYVG